MKEGPLKLATEENTKGVLKQELITYKVVNGMLTKQTVTRNFTRTKDGDYLDTVSDEPLCEVKENAG